MLLSLHVVQLKEILHTDFKGMGTETIIYHLQVSDQSKFVALCETVKSEDISKGDNMEFQLINAFKCNEIPEQKISIARGFFVVVCVLCVVSRNLT